MDWTKYAWLKRGNRRRVTLEVFYKSPIPLSINDVHERSKIALSQASATISELERQELVECLNANDKIGKLYRITSEGKEIINKMAEK